MEILRRFEVLAGVLLVLLVAACAKLAPENKAPGKRKDYSGLSDPKSLSVGTEADPASTGPHGGVVVPLERTKAHLEILHGSESGRLRLYILDADREGPLECADKELKVEIVVSEPGSHLSSDSSPRRDTAPVSPATPVTRKIFHVTLVPFVEDGNGGNFERNAFGCINAELSGLENFRGRLERITIDNVVYRNVDFSYLPQWAR